MYTKKQCLSLGRKILREFSLSVTGIFLEHLLSRKNNKYFYLGRIRVASMEINNYQSVKVTFLKYENRSCICLITFREGQNPGTLGSEPQIRQVCFGQSHQRRHEAHLVGHTSSQRSGITNFLFQNLGKFPSPHHIFQDKGVVAQACSIVCSSDGNPRTMVIRCTQICLINDTCLTSDSQWF